MATPRAVIFDLDGTLLDSAIAITIALNELTHKHGKPQISKKQAAAWVSLGAAQLVTNALGEAESPEAVDEFRAIYRAMTPDPADLFPHVPEMLAELTASGHKIGICTNKPEDLARMIIGGIGIGHMIGAIVGGCRPGMPPKPDPAPLFETIRLLGCDKTNTVYVGDSEVDAETAKNAGVPFVLVTFGYAIGKLDAIASDVRIRNFRELPAALSKL